MMPSPVIEPDTVRFVASLREIVPALSRSPSMDTEAVSSSSIPVPAAIVPLESTTIDREPES